MQRRGRLSSEGRGGGSRVPAKSSSAVDAERGAVAVSLGGRPLGSRLVGGPGRVVREDGVGGRGKPVEVSGPSLDRNCELILLGLLEMTATTLLVVFGGGIGVGAGAGG